MRPRARHRLYRVIGILSYAGLHLLSTPPPCHIQRTLFWIYSTTWSWAHLRGLQHLGSLIMPSDTSALGMGLSTPFDVLHLVNAAIDTSS